MKLLEEILEGNFSLRPSHIGIPCVFESSKQRNKSVWGPDAPQGGGGNSMLA